jgi:hypothetical protein
LGARIPLGPRTATVVFNLSGPPGGELTITENARTISQQTL